MERVTKNLSKAGIEERIALVVREHAAADRRIRGVAERLNASFWTMCTCTFIAVAAFIFVFLVRG